MPVRSSLELRTDGNVHATLEKDSFAFYLSVSIGCFHALRKWSPAELVPGAGRNPGGNRGSPPSRGISGARFCVAPALDLDRPQPARVHFLRRIGLPVRLRRAYQRGSRTVAVFV